MLVELLAIGCTTQFREMACVITGVWVPLVTPFKDGAVDLASYRRLIEHYIGQGVSGLFPLGTTGEAPTLDDSEEDAIVAETIEVVAGRVPVFVGIGGNATAKVIKTIKRLGRPRFPGHRFCLPLLQSTDASRHARALHGHRRGDRPSNPDLQHPLSDVGQPHQ